MRSFPVLLPGAAFEAERLAPPDAAVAAYLAQVRVAPPGTETVALDDAYDRILAVDAASPDDLPSADRSTMDGFALASARTPGTLVIAGEVLMGRAPDAALEPGTAIRIPTGGVLPAGADAVVPFEDCTEDDGRIAVAEPVRPGAFVTPRGDDAARGEILAAAGRRIGGPELGLLATAGLARVTVYRRPRIAIVSTGDELVDVDAPAPPGAVRDSNRYAIAGTLRAMGAEPVHLPRSRDTLEALRAALRGALAAADAVVLTGGSSVGVRDLTPDAVAELGSPGVVVHGIRVKPGKPTVLGAVGATPVIGLPGNPTSALMILEAVAAPIVAALAGEMRTVRTREGVARVPIVGRPGWTWYVPVRETEAGVEPLPIRSSHVSLLARATGYVTVPETAGRFEAGARVAVRPFSGMYR